MNDEQTELSPATAEQTAPPTPPRKPRTKRRPSAFRLYSVTADDPQGETLVPFGDPLGYAGPTQARDAALKLAGVEGYIVCARIAWRRKLEIVQQQRLI